MFRVTRHREGFNIAEREARHVGKKGESAVAEKKPRKAHEVDDDEIQQLPEGRADAPSQDWTAVPWITRESDMRVYDILSLSED